MIREARSWRIRLAFEPNRFSCKQLESVYEQLKPMDARVALGSSLPKLAATKLVTVKQGGR